MTVDHTQRAAVEHAFTMVEVLVVMVIIGVLLAIALPKMQGWQDASRRDGGVAAARSYARAVEAFSRDHAGRPPRNGTPEWPTATLSKGPVDLATGKFYLRQVPEPLQDKTAAFDAAATGTTPIVLRYRHVAGPAASPEVWSVEVLLRKAGTADKVICQLGTSTRPAGVAEC
jgi:prepilin-type N-terminal cleavage/methylation domain-containing protein